MYEKYEIISSVCFSLSAGDRQGTVNLLQSSNSAMLETEPKQSKLKGKRRASIDNGNAAELKARIKRQYTTLQSARLFIYDGFTDRYDGERLIFPGVLRLLSDTFPNEFPYHPNWKTGACHQCYWVLFPTVDHIEPVTDGGADAPGNWVTTSMLNNLIKSNTPLETLGWNIAPRGNFNEWDGLIYWFINYVDENTGLLQITHINNWYKAAIRALKT